MSATAVPTVAIVSSSPALASLLAAMLGMRHRWRVRTFETLAALGTYMRIAPVAAIVSDVKLADGSLAEFADGARHGEMAQATPPTILGLTRAVSPDLQRVCLAAGIDEIIVKPMSPGYIEDRLAFHLGDERPRPALTPRYRGPERRGRIVLEDGRYDPVERRGENVVSLAAYRAARSAAVHPG